MIYYFVECDHRETDEILKWIPMFIGSPQMNEGGYFYFQSPLYDDKILLKRDLILIKSLNILIRFTVLFL